MSESFPEGRSGAPLLPGRSGGAFGSLTDFLYPMPARRTVGGIVRWWEKRRLAYNVAVGTAGVFTIVVGHLFLALPPDGFVNTDFGWWPIPIVYGVLANVCYLLGPTIEILVEKIWRGQVLPTGPALYRMGLTFALGLTLLPALVHVIFWVARIVWAIV